MKKFMLTYHNTAESLAQWSNATPEQKAEGMKPWVAWKAKWENNILDFGAPVGGGQTVGSNGNTSPSAREITGYSVIQADSREAAILMLADHPHHHGGSGASIELHECISM